MDPPPLLAVDVPWLLYRSHFALPSSIKGSDGKPVGALLGTVNALLGVVEWCSPRAVACCFGAEEAAHRVALYQPYHAHRDPMPEPLRDQWAKAPELLAAFGFAIAADEELEADDLLFSLARAEGRTGGRTLILTADRDLYQAVDARTAVVHLRRNAAPELVDVAGVRKRSGVEPDRIAELIALRGDPSDGLPGARGVGPKTAATLLAEHGTLEGVLAASYRLGPRIGSALREQAQELRCFREVALLVEVEVERPPDRELDRAGGAAAAEALGMVQLAKRLRQT